MGRARGSYSQSRARLSFRSTVAMIGVGNGRAVAEVQETLALIYVRATNHVRSLTFSCLAAFKFKNRACAQYVIILCCFLDEYLLHQPETCCTQSYGSSSNHIYIFGILRDFNVLFRCILPSTDGSTSTRNLAPGKCCEGPTFRPLTTRYRLHDLMCPSYLDRIRVSTERRTNSQDLLGIGQGAEADIS